MRERLGAVAVACAIAGFAVSARADRVVLASGEVIEGKVTRQGGRITIEVESGSVTLPAEAVARVEKADSLVEQFNLRRAALKKGDVAGRLSLADYCRDHGMRARERELLQEVLEIDQNHAGARARLGYVKADGGWITEADAKRAQGLTLHEGRWVTEGELRDITRREEEATAAAVRRDEDDELEAKRRRLANEQAELEAERVKLEARRTPYGMIGSGYSPYYSPLYFPPIYPTAYRFSAPATRVFDECPPGRPCRRAPAPLMAPPADSTSLSVVKVPYRFSR